MSTSGIEESLDFGAKKNKSRHSKTEKGELPVVGHETSQYTDFRTRNTSCRKCLKSKRKGKPVMKHERRKNHQGLSKSMEPLVAVKRFQEEKYPVVIGDDDSVISRTKKKVITNIDKWSDVNQVLCDFKKHLYAVRDKSCGPGSDGISDNVIERFSKCFSYCLRQHKNDPSGLKAGLQVIVPHLFGDHSKCEVWCKYNNCAHRYKHTNLPSGRELKGEDLRKFLVDVIQQLSTDKAVKKMASLGLSRIKNCNSIANPKSMFHEGSKNGDFLQNNEGNSHQQKGKEKVGVTNNHTDLVRSIERMNRKRQLTCKRKSEPAAKIHRRVSKSKDNSKAKKERNKGSASCQEMAFPNLVTEEEFLRLSLDQSRYTKVQSFLDENQLIHRLVKPSVTPSCQDEQYYKSMVFDIETSGLSMDAEILQLSCVLLKSGQTFTSYIMPKGNISSSSSKVHNLHIKYLNRQRILCKNKVPVQAEPLLSVLEKFVDFLENTATGQPLLLIGHNANAFDTPRVVNKLVGVKPLMKRLHKLQVYFGDSLPAFKTQLLDRGIKMKLSDLYNEATGETFDAHDALEDVIALKKLILHYGNSFINKIVQDSKPLTYFVKLHKYKITEAICSNSYQAKPLKKPVLTRLVQNGLPFLSLKTAYQICRRKAFIAYLTYKNGLNAPIAKGVDDVNQILTIL